ncbi:MAG: RnfABCDGE type electron transport complex subunit G, partial [Rhizobium sp.]|nr:RnfABCDGE type electron transport complex subunit G [Rhizobium sp.]
MRDMVKPTITLFVICFAVALCLALVNSLTKETIIERAIAGAEEQRKQVLSEAERFKKLENWKDKTNNEIVREAYSAYKGEKLVGYVFSAFPKGYGGEMQITVGITSDGKVSGVSLGDNKETPGLGTKASEDDFIGQYKGKNSQNTLQVVKRAPSADNEIQAISGATITSKAVTSAVQASAELAGKLMQDGGEAE